MREKLKNIIKLKEINNKDRLINLCYLNPFFDMINYSSEKIEKLYWIVNYFKNKKIIEKEIFKIKIAFYLAKTKDIENMDFPVEQEFYISDSPGKSDIINFLVELLSFSYRIE